jgi:hypothetical protein
MIASRLFVPCDRPRRHAEYCRFANRTRLTGSGAESRIPRSRRSVVFNALTRVFLIACSSWCRSAEQFREKRRPVEIVPRLVRLFQQTVAVNAPDET